MTVNYRTRVSQHYAYHGYMTSFVINQEAVRGVHIQEQVEEVEHSTVSQLIGLSLSDICVLGNLFIFCDLIVLTYACIFVG